MSEHKPIGGFFELEVQMSGPGYHPDALALTNGRACMRWILEKEKPSRVYIPFYTCYALYEPMEKMGIEYVFYSVDEALDPISIPEPMEGELLVYINYYGLKNKVAEKLSEKTGKRLIIDDTHRFFHYGYKGSYSFTSARKYFGVPDGAYLYGVADEVHDISRNVDISLLHGLKRLLGQQEEAYRDYVEYEASLGCQLKRISLFSERLLSGLDYKSIKETRIENFKYLHDRLGQYNTIPVDPGEMDVPFCYPFLPDQYIDKVKFYKNNIYIPTYWPDIPERDIIGFNVEKDITRRLLPLPVDHRYDISEMKRMSDFIEEMI